MPEPGTGAPRLLIISAVRWNYLWQRHQALATAAARDGWAVDFLEPHPRRAAQVVRFLITKLRRPAGPSTTRLPPQGVRVLPPSSWLRRGDRYDLVLCYIPDRLSERRIRAARCPVVYDAVLDWSTAPPSWYPPRGWRAAEQRIAARASACVTDAPGMASVLRGRGISASVIPPAADDEFPTPAPRTPAPGTAVYFGAVREETDTTVLTALAAAGLRVTVIGAVERAATAALSSAGVEIEHPMPLDELAARVSGFPLVLLPYRGPRAATIAPAKLWNCLAAGRWVLASGLQLPASAPNLVAVPASPEVVVATALRLLDAALPPLGDPPPRWADRWAEIRRAVGE